jgi:hypothetical protein
MTLSKRLERLEAAASGCRKVALDIPRSLERLFEAQEDEARMRAGFPAIERPYTKEDYEDDLDTLEYTIPAYRASAGWRTEEAVAFLDEWERHTREKLGESEAGKEEDAG